MARTMALVAAAPRVNLLPPSEVGRREREALTGRWIWAVFAGSGIDLGMGQTSFNEDTVTWAQAIFAEGIGTFLLMFAILGIVDSRSPSELAGLIIGGAVVAIIMIIGPITGASLNPARAFGPELVSAIGGGPTQWAQLVPVYVLPGLVGAAVAAFAYDKVANPRIIQMPIEEAVTTPDATPREAAAAH